MARNQSANKRDSEYEEKVITISRVSKKTKGGDQMSFTALMVVGDRKGKVGVGLGKAKDVVSAIQKGIKQAKRKMITIPIDGTTIPFAIRAQHGAGKVLLKPASKGSGVIAGGPVRAVVEAAGIKDVSAKILGSDNQASSVHATFQALKNIKKIVKVRGIKIEQQNVVKDETHQQPVAAKSTKSAKSTKPAAKDDKKKSAAKKVDTSAAKKVDTKVKKEVSKKSESKESDKKESVKKSVKASAAKKEDKKEKVKPEENKVKSVKQDPKKTQAKEKTSTDKKDKTKEVKKAAQKKK